MLRLAWSHDSANACLAASSITLMYHHWSQEEAARGNQECHNVRSWIRCWGTSVWTGAGRSDHHQLILRVNEGQTGQRRPRYSDLELHKHWWLLFPSCHKYQDFVWIVVAHVFKLRVSRSSGIMIFPHDRAVTSSAALLTSERHDTAFMFYRLSRTTDLPVWCW